MRDLHLRRGINVVAVGFLSLTFLGCAGDNDDDDDDDEAKGGQGPGPGGQAQPASLTFCEALEQCDATFYESYGTVRECRTALDSSLATFEEYSDQCGERAEAFIRCYGRAAADDCSEASIEAECADAADAFTSACGGYEYYEYYDYYGY